MVLEGDRVQVVIVTTPQAIDKLTETVISIGGEVQGHHEGRLQVLVPIDSLESLAEQQHVQRIREPSQPITLELTETWERDYAGSSGLERRGLAHCGLQRRRCASCCH